MMDFLHLLLHFDQHLGGMIVAHQGLVYGMLFLLVLCEIGVLPLFFLPGDPLLFVCGAFCATGALNIWLLMPVLLLATVLGSLLGYACGQAVGERAYAHDYRWLNRAALQRTQTFYQRYGRITLLLSPFIAVVRTFAPFVAGVGRMTFPHFLASTVAGAALWVLTLVPAGYFFGHLPLVHDHLGALVLLGLAIGLGFLALAAVLRAGRR